MAKKYKKETDEKIISKKEIKYQDKILKIVIIFCVIAILTIALIIFISKIPKKFEYKGVEFKEVNFCDSGPSSCLRTYQTKVPVTLDGKKANYSFYLHKNPEETLEKVAFEGGVNLREELVMDIRFNRFCEGFEQIAVANLLNLYTISVKNITGNEKECNLSAEKMYIRVQEADTTYIEKTGPACYHINIKGCEILEGTERFMIESFAEIKRWTR